MFSLDELLELERKNSEQKTKYLIERSREKANQDLLQMQIAIINMNTTAIVMLAFAGMENKNG